MANLWEVFLEYCWSHLKAQWVSVVDSSTLRIGTWKKNDKSKLFVEACLWHTGVSSAEKADALII